MLASTVIPPGGGEVIGDAPDRRVEVLADHDGLHATWSRFGPGRDGADLHVHRRHTDLFYVLDGELTLRLGAEGEPVVVPAGSLARVPPMVVHGFRNGSGADVRYLNLHAPGQGFADYLRGLRDGRDPRYDQEPPPADGVRPASDAVLGERVIAAEGPGLRVALLADVEEIAVAEVEIAPEAAARATDVAGDQPACLYVLGGELALDGAGGRPVRASAGSWVRVDPGAGAAARVACAGTEALRYLEIRAPRPRPRPA